MNTDQRSLHANLSMQDPTQISASKARPPQRLEVARERIRTVCAERNYFSPVFQVTKHDPSEGRCPPDPDQVQHDLQTMFERFLALESVTANAVYEDISLRVWEMANDENLCLDWEIFQEVARNGVRVLGERGYIIDFEA